jgi:tRNA pseudouridine38-40 synthase
MPRYFLEVSYRGTNYSGFQVQENAITIQSEIEKAFRILQRHEVVMTGSSRTDAGVHCLQNFLHFDYDKEIHPHFIYKINAILSPEIVIKDLIEVRSNAHSRFDALTREYKYYIYRHKNPFLKDRAYYYPYKIDNNKMEQVADLIKNYKDFTSFSKRRTQVQSFICNINESKWIKEKNGLVYYIKADRFLRGMVRSLVATMLLVGRDKISVEEFKTIIEQKDCTKANFAAPAQGLFLISVNYPESYFSL